MGTLSVVSVEPWKAGAAPVAWAGGRIYYNRRPSPSAPFEGWSAKPDGTGARRVTTAAAYPAGTQRGVSDVTPDGKHALVTVERSGHWPLPDGLYAAAPGNGAYNDLYLQTVDGKQTWKLRDLLTAKVNALIWPRFDRAAKRVTWAEQWLYGLPYGGWDMHVADLVWTAGTPALRITASLRSGGILEPFGFSPDGRRVLFAADKLAGTDWANFQVMSLPVSLAGTAKRLSPRDRPDTPDWSNHNEFPAAFPAQPGRIIYSRSVGSFYFSTEYWTAKQDGTDPRQLTSISLPWSPHYQGFLPASLATTYAFDPADPGRFVAAIGTDYAGGYKAVMVTLAPTR